ncbi:MAG: chromosome segregation protein SMC [Phycisphaerae bacterium]|nr:chromosome segregation protein SMC [Phycisphaerae bacterium]
MKLKRITVCGFKSFADKTSFEFGDGVTVVVGPNGCGKSNVVDAVKWVLGAQSAKALRGTQMLDVIFNGSGTRKSMSYAEVQLVFDNTTRMLPHDLDEVSVVRKLFRSGESVYMLNGKNCRLKDIRETFLDTGIGADAYSIIEQGKVESMLQASADERRIIFEEAAGISKYKTRRKEALRKLERTEQNVLRLQDIVNEHDKRLRSIKLQAGKARNYQTYSSRLNELRLAQILSEYNNLQEKSEKTRLKIMDVQDELVALTATTEKAEARLSLLDHDIDRLDNEIHQAENQLLQCTGQIATQEDRIEMGHKRLGELSGMRNRNNSQVQQLRQQSSHLQENAIIDQAQIDNAQNELQAKQDKLRQLQDQRQELILELNEYRDQLEDEKSGVIDIVRRTAQLHNEINSIDYRCDNLTGQKDRLSNRSGQISEEIETLLSQRMTLEEKLVSIKQIQAESQFQLEEKRQKLAKLSEEQLKCSENLSTAKEYRSGLLSRQQLLSDLEAKFDGVDQGVKQILQARQNSDEYLYVKGMLAEFIQADVQYAGIIEAALADKAQHLVITDSTAVLADADKLGELKGRVQMICLDRFTSTPESLDINAFPQIKNKLIDLVSYPADCEILARNLLANTLLVEGLSDAFDLIGQLPRDYRFVTLSGEVLEADGTLHVGPQIAETGLISRKSELRQLEESLAEAADRINDLQYQSEQYVSQAQHLDKNLQELRTVIYETSTEEVEIRGLTDQIDHNLEKLKHEQPLIASEIDTLDAQIHVAHQSKTDSQQKLEELEEVSLQRNEHIEFLEERIDILQSQDEEIQSDITDVKVSFGQIQQRTMALREKIASVKSQLQRYQHNIATLQNELDHADENYVTTELSILNSESRIADLFSERQCHQEVSGKLRIQRYDLHEEKVNLYEQTKVDIKRREELQGKLHQQQMQYNEARLKIENINQRAMEELQIDVAETLQTTEIQEMDWEAVSAEIKDLRSKINRLGNINLDSITEQEELEKRSETLLAQAKDLSEAKKELEDLIETINVKSIELFRKNFEIIRENFADLFRKLFGGGKAEIVLQDPDNMLECGIDIVARPPGKQLQNISLMSGGEKTMTAVALLMAIFKSKPSPFCLLDEVDAALDEANNERFNMVVQEFLSESQFVIITHSRRTMSIANTIYGVTMQERGVSKKVSVQFAEDDIDPTNENAA